MSTNMKCTTELKDKLIGALIGLARATDGNTQPTGNTYKALIKGLSIGFDGAELDDERVIALIDEVHEEKKRLVPSCASCAAPCGRNDDYDMSGIWNADEETHNLKGLVLLTLRGLAVCGMNAGLFDCSHNEMNIFIAKSLFAIGEDWGKDDLLPILFEAGEISLKYMK